MINKKFLEHPTIVSWGGENNNGMVQWAEVFEELCFPSCSILLIGTGWKHEQYHTWPNLLKDVWNANCSYLEIAQNYIDKWKDGPYPLYEGSVVDIQNVIHHKFDVILWIQGPEHIKYEEMLPTFDAMFNLSNIGIACSCPWGSYYDHQETVNDNHYERHLQKNITENYFGQEFSNYTILFGGVKDSGNGQVLIWRKHDL